MTRNRQPYSRYSKQLKLEAIKRVIEEEQPVQDVIADLGIRHRDNVYEWIKKYRKDGPSAFDRSLPNTVQHVIKSPIEEQVEELKVEVEALKKYIEILMQGEEEKYRAIEALEGKYPVELLCNALDIQKQEFEAYRERRSTLR
ncbi:transposase [Ornithinibacillus scapharcae]|uniref:transposase n=1 Tax=Ornithinibacillus scapharcae TaxID=1147159 RepID=UPI000225BBF1|nr:transposase [Ornithinibacillus scapharcae]